MSKAARREGTDPENVLDLVREVYDELPAGASDLIAFREMWYYLQDQGSAGGEDVKEVGWTAAQDGLQTVYGTRGDWWQQTADPLFRQLPGVIPPSEAPASTRLLHRLPGVGPGRSSGGTWRYDESGRDWPDAPSETASLSDDVLDELLNTADVPGSNAQQTGRSRIPLGKMYRHLEEHGSASPDELKSYYRDDHVHNAPEQGLFPDANAWFRDVGRPVLSELPGVAPPRTIGDEWRFIGVSEKTVEHLSE
ncbi:hypothetical protein [Halorussus halobius]|uniref:hypothetical protein n=1 Tax=Halorussus halobius TaxID=1710537 RepID=UPI001091AD90|nr:hypothetical protein [Halorussus halobius]